MSYPDQHDGWNPRSADVERFTEGDCHLLARAIHKRTGWPLCAFKLADSCGNYIPVDHCFVHAPLPDGQVPFDVMGLWRSTYAFNNWWGYSSSGGILIYDTWNAFLAAGGDIWATPAISSYSYARAGVIAERLLSHYEIDPRPENVTFLR